MKRGFLTTPRAKKAIEEAYAPESSRQGGPPPPPRRTQEGGGKAAAAEDAIGTGCVCEAELPSIDEDNATTAEPPSEKSKGKAKEKVVDTEDDDTEDDDSKFGCPIDLPPRPPPQRPGWGRHPDEDFFHTVPQAPHGGPRRKRAVFCRWPRDPNGKTMTSSDKPRGTLSPDGYPWGATLYDFYTVYRFPWIHGMLTFMTGSALCEAMAEIGELDAAESEIEWAKSEGKPRVLGVANTEELIECLESRSQLKDFHNYSMRDDVCRTVSPENDDDDTADEREIEYDDTEVDPATIPPPPTIPVTSPFHPSHYPPPWPFIPFSDPLSILLQERIPLYLLPQTLYVHDPFNLLRARERRFRDTSWKSRPDIVRTYTLNLSQSICKEVEEARRKAEELEEFKARTLIIMRYKRTKEQIKNYEPMIEVPLPPYPRRMTKVDESHLYLSPVGKVGKGNHSIIYKAEWELPRDLLTRPKVCQRCFEESADKEIKRLKDTGRWEKMLRAVGWGPTGLTGRKPTRAELDEVNDPTNLERDGEIIEREITCVVRPNAPPSQIFDTLERSDIWDVLMKGRHGNAVGLDLAGDEDEVESTKDSYAPRIRIDPPFSYESQKSCTHGPRCFPIPRTARFTAVAKLSIENDPHLETEASNYQQFPERFFDHYNGYTLIAQLHAVVPVNAVVPQFYGYYTLKNQGREPYLSPILLIEHCGQPIDPNELSKEDQEECASLLLRFQGAGWLHESVAPRNFLVQAGKPTEFPLMRQSNPEPSFRLIDFGRSRNFSEVEEKQKEEMETLMMFEKLWASMNVTISM